ncbi:hypothetical protein F383_30583 [Gossypium arboreum]|uniref:Uncharacterized protein n=1 Tax=Gossypium arboreum TaxID=29729 RepID=A0A0B0N2N6_GOSAR|nr:hypothetical protein F383_30583 [Gossypium arboreum]
MGQRGKSTRPRLPHTGILHARVNFIESTHTTYTSKPHARPYLTP